MRAELRRCMRAVSVPDVDWDGADAAVARVQALAVDLRARTLMGALGDGGFRQFGDRG